MLLSYFIVGCDVSKARIDFFDTSTRQHTIIPNERDSIKRFVARYRESDVGFAFEATGFYGDQLRRTLARYGVEGIQINPLHARRFAQSSGRLAKTDRIDAIQLADMARCLELQAEPVWNDDIEELKSLITRRDQLVDMRSQESMRRKQTTCALIGGDLERHIEMLSEQITRFEVLIKRMIGDNEAMNRKAHLLQSIPGIGPATAAVLIALLPQTGKINRSAIAALAGLAPMAHDSGTISKRRTIAGGRPRVRKALYQCAIAIIRTKSRFAAKYHDMIKAGKPPKVVLIAIARKIIVTANAILKSNKIYQ